MPRYRTPRPPKPRDKSGLGQLYIPGPRHAYGVNEVAIELCLSPRTVTAYIKSGKLRAVKLGGRRIILAKDLQAFLDEIDQAHDATPAKAGPDQ